MRMAAHSHLPGKKPSKGKSKGWGAPPPRQVPTLPPEKFREVSSSAEELAKRAGLKTGPPARVFKVVAGAIAITKDVNHLRSYINRIPAMKISPKAKEVLSELLAQRLLEFGIKLDKPIV